MPDLFKDKKIAIIHYWWISNRGGESVISSLCNIFPEADLFFHVCDEPKVRNKLGSNFKGNIHKTIISKLPFAKKHYQKYLPFMPFALESLDLSDYDIVISSEAGPTKGVITKPDCIHFCYCHSPMRYIWDMGHEYTRNMGVIKKLLFRIISHKLRIWDITSVPRVDHFISNSSFIKKRITKFYKRDSKVIHPPIAVKNFNHQRKRKEFYLCLGQLVPYKRIDMAIDAFNDLGIELVVIGEGEQFKYLSQIKKNNICLLGRQDFSVVKEYLETCKALIFPGIEDFGIVPVEASAAGAPVIGFNGGGIRDTVLHGKNGILYEKQTKEHLINAVQAYEKKKFVFDSDEISEYAKKFDIEVFESEIKNFIHAKLKEV